MGRILQGTTPILTIEVLGDLTAGSAEALELSFKSGNTLTRKGLSDVTIDGNEITYHFTEAETLALTAEDRVLYWQLRIQIDGEIYGTPIQKIIVDDLMSEVALS